MVDIGLSTLAPVKGVAIKIRVTIIIIGKFTKKQPEEKKVLRFECGSVCNTEET